MSHHLEVEIQQMLGNGFTAHNVAKELLQRIGVERMSAEKKLCILNFAYNSGYYKGIAEYAHTRLEMSKDLPWGLFAQVISMAGLSFNTTLVNHLFQGAQTHRNIPSLLGFHQWDHLDPRFNPLRQSLLESFQKKLVEKRERLIEKIQFMREERILDQEKLAMDQLAVLFPNDPFLKEIDNSFSERWARDIINRRASAIREARVEKRAVTLDKDQQKWVEDMTANLPQILKEHPEQSYNLAITFKMMELPALAVIALQSATKEEDCEWLLIELLLETGCAVIALDKIFEIEQKYATNPDTSFSANYLRAQALWSLGEKALAISIISSIIKVRPLYRSATALQSQWLGDRDAN